MYNYLLLILLFGTAIYTSQGSDFPKQFEFEENEEDVYPDEIPDYSRDNSVVQDRPIRGFPPISIYDQKDNNFQRDEITDQLQNNGLISDSMQERDWFTDTIKETDSVNGYEQNKKGIEPKTVRNIEENKPFKPVKPEKGTKRFKKKSKARKKNTKISQPGWHWEHGKLVYKLMENDEPTQIKLENDVPTRRRRSIDEEDEEHDVYYDVDKEVDDDGEPFVWQTSKIETVPMTESFLEDFERKRRAIEEGESTLPRYKRYRRHLPSPEITSKHNPAKENIHHANNKQHDGKHRNNKQAGHQTSHTDHGQTPNKSTGNKLIEKKKHIHKEKKERTKSHQSSDPKVKTDNVEHKGQQEDFQHKQKDISSRHQASLKDITPPKELYSEDSQDKKVIVLPADGETIRLELENKLKQINKKLDHIDTTLEKISIHDLADITSMPGLSAGKTRTEHKEANDTNPRTNRNLDHDHVTNNHDRDLKDKILKAGESTKVQYVNEIPSERQEYHQNMHREHEDQHSNDPIKQNRQGGDKKQQQRHFNMHQPREYKGRNDVKKRTLHADKANKRVNNQPRHDNHLDNGLEENIQSHEGEWEHREEDESRYNDIKKHHTSTGRTKASDTRTYINDEEASKQHFSRNPGGEVDVHDSNDDEDQDLQESFNNNQYSEYAVEDEEESNETDLADDDTIYEDEEEEEKHDEVEEDSDDEHSSDEFDDDLEEEDDEAEEREEEDEESYSSDEDDDDYDEEEEDDKEDDKESYEQHDYDDSDEDQNANNEEDNHAQEDANHRIDDSSDSDQVGLQELSNTIIPEDINSFETSEHDKRLKDNEIVQRLVKKADALELAKNRYPEIYDELNDEEIELQKTIEEIKYSDKTERSHTDDIIKLIDEIPEDRSFKTKHRNRREAFQGPRIIDTDYGSTIDDKNEKDWKPQISNYQETYSTSKINNTNSTVLDQKTKEGSIPSANSKLQQKTKHLKSATEDKSTTGYDSSKSLIASRSRETINQILQFMHRKTEEHKRRKKTADRMRQILKLLPEKKLKIPPKTDSDDDDTKSVENHKKKNHQLNGAVPFEEREQKLNNTSHNVNRIKIGTINTVDKQVKNGDSDISVHEPTIKETKVPHASKGKSVLEQHEKLPGQDHLKTALHIGFNKELQGKKVHNAGVVGKERHMAARVQIRREENTNGKSTLQPATRLHPLMRGEAISDYNVQPSNTVQPPTDADYTLQPLTEVEDTIKPPTEADYTAQPPTEAIKVPRQKRDISYTKRQKRDISNTQLAPRYATNSIFTKLQELLKFILPNFVAPNNLPDNNSADTLDNESEQPSIFQSIFQMLKGNLPSILSDNKIKLKESGYKINNDRIQILPNAHYRYLMKADAQESNDDIAMEGIKSMQDVSNEVIPTTDINLGGDTDVVLPTTDINLDGDTNPKIPATETNQYGDKITDPVVATTESNLIGDIDAMIPMTDTSKNVDIDVVIPMTEISKNGDIDVLIPTVDISKKRDIDAVIPMKDMSKKGDIDVVIPMADINLTGDPSPKTKDKIISKQQMEEDDIEKKKNLK